MISSDQNGFFHATRGARYLSMPLLLAILSWLLPLASSYAHEEKTPAGGTAAQVAFDQKLDAQLPLDLSFRDEQGHAVRLGEYFGKQPVILAPVYYECSRLCPLVLDGVVRSLRALPFAPGKELKVVAFSIDPAEGPAQAREKRQVVVKRYSRSATGEGWHFLTGDEHTIAALSDAIGFRYARQRTADSYAHASGIVLLTPAGYVSRYFYGFDFAPRDLKLGLIEAAQAKIGSPIDYLLLLCYEYDPATGKYGLVILNSLRVGGLVTATALGTFLVIMFRRERRRNIPAKENS